VVYRCFELDPTAEREINYSMYEMLAKKYGMSIEQAMANTQNVERMAREVGLDYHLDTAILTNTFDAHRLTMFAKANGKMREMTDRILKAYFTDSKHIGDHETLVMLAEEVGLSREAVKKMLENNEFSAAVRADEQEAQQLGIRSVPFFVINRKYSISGAQSTDTFINAIRKIHAEDGPVSSQ
jgi:predicted DsbA family dithiol-disulfide isomerase